MLTRMSKKNSLSRLNIIGQITSETPKCVIYEVAESLSYEIARDEERDSYCEMVIDKIKEKQLEDLEIDENNNFSKEDAAKIIVFVSGTHRDGWTFSNLKLAFKHLQTYSIDRIPEIPSNNFHYGAKSSQFPLNYDACILYRICTYNNIKTTRNMTLEQLAYLVKLLNEDSTDVRNNILTMIRMMPKHQLLTLSLSAELKNPPNISQKTVNTSISLPIPGNNMSSCLPDIKRGRLDCDKIISSHKKITDINHLIPRIDPKNHEEAIVLAGLVYGINLTDTINPYREYIEMTFNGEDVKYIPTGDSLFKIKYLLNSLWYDARRTWSPYLQSLYTNEQLLAFAKSEGYKELKQDDEKFANSNNATEFLNMTRVTQTFYLGVHPSIIKNESDIDNLRTVVEMEDVFEIGPAKIISFGIADSNEFKLYTAESLTRHFTIHKKFTNPTSPSETFSRSSVSKLKNICREFTGDREQILSPVSNGRTSILSAVETIASIPLLPGFSTMANSIVTFANMFNKAYKKESKDSTPKNINVNELVTDYTELLKAIEAIELLNIATSAHAERLRSLYEDVIYKEHIERFLFSLLHVGYYMRGWKVQKSSSYIDKETVPITSEETNTLRDVHGEIEVNVSDAIRNLEACIKKCPLNIVSDLRSLPLMMSYNDSVNDLITYNPASNPEDGYTILDRIAICKSGTSILSCIRTSSNHFLSSAYYYMCGCGMNPPFNIKRMSKIS